MGSSVHIPSKSSGNDRDDAPLHAHVEQPLKPRVHQCKKIVAAYNSIDEALVKIPNSKPEKPEKLHEVSLLIGEYSRC
jgi:hypothetical protein